MKTKPRILHTYAPEPRPTYHQWVKEMRITEANWREGEGKRRADEIRERTGIRYLTLWERILSGE